jgi:hypothetical protein
MATHYGENCKNGSFNARICVIFKLSKVQDVWFVVKSPVCCHLYMIYRQFRSRAT